MKVRENPLKRNARLIVALAAVLIFSGCTTVQYNGPKPVVTEVDYPPIGEVVTAYVGDHMVEKGTLYQAVSLRVSETIEGALYTIPAKSYPQIGYDDEQSFYDPTGVQKSFLADPFKALSVDRNQNKEVCVVTVFGVESCFEGQFEEHEVILEGRNGFQQTLIYSGRVGNKVNVGYREFSSDRARPAFNNEVEYDLTESRIIGYKGAELEIIDADNSKIRYRVIKNFPSK